MSLFSDYYSKLSAVSKTRYLEKISKIGGVDPYSLPESEFSKCQEDFPDIDYPDICNYLLYSPSPVSLEEMKNFKSLESYNQFLCGWVRDVGVKLYDVGDKMISLIRGRVLHSQRLSDTPTNVWIITEKTGRIYSAHCNCMAGLGESCSHVGATLFCLSKFYKDRQSKTVTEEKAYWVNPATIKDIEFAEVSGINFTAPSTLKRKHDAPNREAAMPHITKSSSSSSRKIKGPNDTELASFFRNLSLSGANSALLSLIPHMIMLMYRKLFKAHFQSY